MQIRLSALLVLLFGALVCAQTQENKGKRPSITGISHVVVLNDNLSASSSFYHGLLDWPESKALEPANALHYQVGPDQYVEVKQVASATNPVDRVDHVAFKTEDARAMRKYLAL
ncbi:MAG: VOC family protein, partial [Bryocella sp.]